MTKTKNLELSVVDTNETRVADWVEALSSATESNMTIIDEVVAGKAESSVVIQTTLLASGWAGVDSPFTQTIHVEGLSETGNGTISVAHEATAEERAYARDAMLLVTGQADGVLVISADGEMPDVDIPVSVMLLG